ncbi:hypothetical protein H7Y63_03910 [Polaromonas sp.]|nr:hypothetical protein [Candidatus Saccharibacteria bacterium]
MTKTAFNAKIKKGLRHTNNWAAARRNNIALTILLVGLVGSLLLRQLAYLPNGALSNVEHLIALAPVGFHGILSDPFYLIPKVLHSLGFYFFGQGGALVTRLPSVILGAIAIGSFMFILRAWHGTKVALLGTVLFATSAWTLHISRYGSYDSSYLVALPLLWASQIALRRWRQIGITYVVIFIWGSLLYIPGMAWFIALSIWSLRDELSSAWRLSATWWKKILLGLTSLLWLPLLLYHFLDSPKTVLTWLGLPQQFDTLSQMARRLSEVPLNLFLYGPNAPASWLARLPILDIFSAVMVILGIVFYIKHWRSSRARQLLLYAVLASLLISVNSRVSLSLLIPLVYIVAASGIARILRDWLQHFPNNPIVRTVGITVITIAVAVSCVYNVRHYFVAWPHNAATNSAFTHHPY